MRHLTDEQEEMLADLIRTEYINKGNFCPRAVLADRALEIWRDAHREGAEWRGEEFQELHPVFSSRWSDRFLKNHQLSLRSPHHKRRADPDDEITARYLECVERSYVECHRDHVFNMDETCWRVCPTRLLTIAIRGAEAVECSFDFCAKSCITVIAGVSAAEDDDEGKIVISQYFGLN
jgi:hypothetical protein